MGAWEEDGNINRNEEGRMNMRRKWRMANFILDISNRIFVWDRLLMLNNRCSCFWTSVEERASVKSAMLLGRRIFTWII